MNEATSQGAAAGAAAAATPMCPVVHFEMPAHDRARAIAFYSGAFGWKMQQLGPDMGNYILAETAGSDLPPPGFRGAIGGGLFEPAGPAAGAGVSVVLAVENLEAAAERVRRHGGQTTGEAMVIPGVGRFMSFTDTEGNHNGMLEPFAAAAPQAQPG
ncbi:VOC family protein [Camelimonas abortus]|uniref:VOC family protein n=1 Tax=Camelimonas abortus TaxID=1017184 RepID=A0ABV7LGW2_9HYPH